ncbi:MAG: tetratricopeptide repeat protein [Anaerolineae bacterium]|nr:tetratricopeptide repeat protein [Anaerolineae bacterium]
MPSRPIIDPINWWDKIVVALELADLTDSGTRDKLDSAAAKALNQGLHTAAAWQYARALPMLTAAIEIWTRLDHVPGLIQAQNTRGAVYRKIGAYDAAREDYQAALLLAHEHDLSGGEITARAGLGAIHTAHDAYDDAQTLLNQALEQARSTVDNWGMGYTQRLLGQFYEARKEWDAALHAYGSAVEIWRAVVAPVEEIEATTGMASVMLVQGHAVGAYSLIEAVLRHLGKNGPARLDEPLRVYFTIYRVLQTMQQGESAQDMLRTAYQMMHKHAEGLSDAHRAAYFETVPLHRAIDAAWEASRDTPDQSYGENK